MKLRTILATLVAVSALTLTACDKAKDAVNATKDAAGDVAGSAMDKAKRRSRRSS